MKISKLILIALGVSLVAGHAWAAPYVILKDGTRVDGTQIRALPNGNINLQVGAGRVLGVVARTGTMTITNSMIVKPACCLRAMGCLLESSTAVYR